MIPVLERKFELNNSGQLIDWMTKWPHHCAGGAPVSGNCAGGVGSAPAGSADCSTFWNGA